MTSDLLEISAEILAEAGFASNRSTSGNRQALTFEDPTVLGFLVAYETPNELLASWSTDTNRLIHEHQLSLRRAGTKAWNTYIVVLARDKPTYRDLVGLAAIEEDLTGTRKIARAGIQQLQNARAALLTLLPLQSAPQLEAVDLTGELRARTTQLNQPGVDAFISHAEASTVLQLLEQAP